MYKEIIGEIDDNLGIGEIDDNLGITTNTIEITTNTNCKNYYLSRTLCSENRVMEAVMLSFILRRFELISLSNFKDYSCFFMSVKDVFNALKIKDKKQLVILKKLEAAKFIRIEYVVGRRIIHVNLHEIIKAY